MIIGKEPVAEIGRFYYAIRQQFRLIINKLLNFFY